MRALMKAWLPEELSEKILVHVLIAITITAREQKTSAIMMPGH
jgi:hypothetical protein